MGMGRVVSGNAGGIDSGQVWRSFFSKLRNLDFTLKAMGRRLWDLSRLVSLSYLRFIRLLLAQ